ncbi:copper transport protein [Streptomyces zhaozhouensis]|uniref:Copper transport protein n=1 Tax=Streptomyces zhaozhouensis TaxID=1300267 RepID=A0A286DYG3_9ACTN|nr:FixH family protein [Streptomyces zhaozhouensis]SOD63699.1 copper transport protein [Streptomyces zhaozhouensis]
MIAAVSRPLGALLLAVGTLAALLVGAQPAAAHASLTGTSPGDGEVVATAPAEVVLTFSEPVSVGEDSLRVLDPDGARVDTGEVTRGAGGAEQTLGLADDLGDGTHTVAWQAISNDGHPISGAFTFSVGAPSETSVDVAGSSPDGGAVGLLHDALRYAAYAGFLLLVGPAVFALVCWPGAAGRRAVRRTTVVGWLTLAVATAALLLVRVPYTTTGRLGDAFDLDGIADVVDSRAGTALLTRLVLLSAAALPVALLHGRYARAVAAGDARLARDLRFGVGVGGGALAVGLAATWATAEHAATGLQTEVAIPVAMVHLLATACWLGGLVTLLVLLRGAEGPPPAAAVRRYSTVALAGVATLAATGLYQSWRQVGSFSALTGTDYGRLLIVKVVVVAVLLGVAWGSRRWTGALRDDDDGAVRRERDRERVAETVPEEDPERARQLARQRVAVERTRRRREEGPERAGLRRTVLVETGVAVVLLAVTTALTGTPPARGEGGASTAASDSGGAAERPAPLEVAYDTGGAEGVATLELAPGTVGENTLEIALADAEGRPAEAEELRVSLTLPEESVGPLRVETEPVAEGRWRATGVQLPRPGEWELDLTLRTSEVDQTTETTTLTVP